MGKCWGHVPVQALAKMVATGALVAICMDYADMKLVMIYVGNLLIILIHLGS
jgi:hypothetical protein